jgi:hypothetical protein
MPGKNMAKTTTKTLLVALLSLAASTALSQNNQGQDNDNQGQNYRGGRTVSAPEFDPGQALGALALLGGTFAIIRGYRRKKK